MYEHHSKPVISRKAFALRLSVNVAIAGGFVFVSLLLGMIGYRVFEKLNWIDAFLNASMILGGMGEVDPLKTDAGKIFAGFYALYSGLLVIVSFGLILTPVFHRMMHRFHAHKPD